MTFNKYSNTALFVLLFAIVACNSFPYKTSNRAYKKQAKALAKQLLARPYDVAMSDSIANLPVVAPEWVGTTNFDLRKPNFVIIHHTAQNACEQTLKTFTMVQTKVSAHYVICKDGTVHHMLNDYLRAWHGGVAKWGNNTDINSSSIGIELDNNGYEPFDPRQITSLLHVLAGLKAKYSIPDANFIGHGDIAPKRKVDPNIQFPWQQLAQNGFGIWFEPNPAISLNNNISVPYALALVGYDIKDSTAAKLAFKRHFRQDSTSRITLEDKSVLAQLIQQKLSK